MVDFKSIKATGASDPVLTRLAEEDKVPWYRKPKLRYLYFMLTLACMGSELTSGYDSQLSITMGMVPSWRHDLGSPQGGLKGFVGASYSLGAILSLPFVPYVNENFGRRCGITTGSLIMLIGSIIQGFAQNVGMYILARMIIGFGIPVCIVAGASLIGELSHPKERPVLTSLFNVAFYVGNYAGIAICYRINTTMAGDAAWRIPSFLQICPSLLQLGLVYFLPESPHWLIFQNRSEEANEVLIEYHAEGDRNSDFVRAEMAHIKTVLALEMESSKQSWTDLFRTAGMRHRSLVSAMLALFTQWSGNAMTGYFFMQPFQMLGLAEGTARTKINFGMAAFSFLAALVAALVVRSFRRRTMYLTCTIAGLVCYTAWAICTERMVYAKENKYQDQSAAIAALFFLFMYTPSYSIGFNALTYTYLVELWPYVLRSHGISLFQLFGRSASFIGTIIGSMNLFEVSWRALFGYCCWLAFHIAVVYFIFPETSGRTLEELAFLFEDKAIADQAAGVIEKALSGDGMDAVGSGKSGHGRSRLVKISKSSV